MTDPFSIRERRANAQTQQSCAYRMLKARALVLCEEDGASYKQRLLGWIIAMDLRRDIPAAGLRRLNGVLEWRGAPEGIPAKERIERLTEIARDLHDVYCEGCRERTDAFDAGHDLVSRSLPKLLRSNSPDELAREESEILGALIDAASQHIKAWSDFKAKIESYRSGENGAC